jgi:TPR repeat protein
LVSLLFNASVISAGASGAIFGIYGAVLGYLGRQRSVLPKTVLTPLLQSAAVFVAFNLLYGLLAYVDQAVKELGKPDGAAAGGLHLDQGAHLGGLISGLLFGFLAARPLDLGIRADLLRSRALGLAAGVVTVMVLTLFPVVRQPRSDGAVYASLGALYLDPRHGATNTAMGMGYMIRAGEVGQLTAQQFLARAYYDGKIVKKDLPEAFLWLSKAAAQGDTKAAALLPALGREIEDAPEVRRPRR